MAEASKPPQTAAAAAAGGFGGAVLGVIAASAFMGDGNDGNAQTLVQPEDAQTVEMVAKSD